MDVCDRCGQRAYVQTWHPRHGRLTWCAHHYTEHRVELLLRLWLVEVDERDSLMVPA